MTYKTPTQETCFHDAKVKMAGYRNLYECTRCHKFIPIDISKEIVHTSLAS
ncbi:hypothetical protein [Nitrosopumilus sp.]|uniref:hypothetical protein n=1 Tax=Nitrosopumilus sp. TaxID=2024843 RepID=UPI00247EAB8A|nr:hypothetical protein [Nitrosopumilus sp.]MCV0409869.1 hypothetical protein [Nitrosopumilus sp.]